MPLKGKNMKIRNGFVSNSSSSSFIVKASGGREANDKGLCLIKVKEIKAIFREMEEVVKKNRDKLLTLGLNFMFEYNGPWIGDYTLESFDGLDDEDYISEPYDRDRAYEQGIDYPVFAGDL